MCRVQLKYYVVLLGILVKVRDERGSCVVGTIFLLIMNMSTSVITQTTHITITNRQKYIVFGNNGYMSHAVKRVIFSIVPCVVNHKTPDIIFAFCKICDFAV